MPSPVPWRVLVTVPALVAVTITFGVLFASTGDNATLAIAAGAAGALGGYLGKLNGSPG